MCAPAKQGNEIGSPTVGAMSSLLTPLATGAAAGENVHESIAELEKSQQELQEASSATIAANLEQLTALQQRLEVDRARLAKTQRRTKVQAVTLNAADVEQQRVLVGIRHRVEKENWRQVRGNASNNKLCAARG